MKKNLIFLALLFNSLFANDFSLMTGWEKLSDQEICASDCNECHILGVNVVTGSYHDTSVDFVSKGIDPLKIERAYFRQMGRKDFYRDLDAPNLLGWYVNFDYLFFADNLNSEFTCNILLSHPSGSLIHFKKNHKKNVFRLSTFKGFMNDSAHCLSGQTHWKNAYISFSSNKEYQVHLPDGSSISFFVPKGLSGLHVVPASFVSKRNLSGSRVKLENGKIVTRAPDGTILNWIHRIKLGNFAKIETSDGKSFLFTPSKEVAGGRHLLGSITYPDGAFIKYTYMGIGVKKNDFITAKQFPDGRYLRIHYKKNESKVERLEAPCGSQGAKCTLYRFSYGDNFTEVYDSKGNKTKYEYDDENRITCVRKFDGEKLVRIEKSVWNDSGCLLGKVLFGPDEKPYVARTFEYDSANNVTCEKLYGNLTGVCQKQIELTGAGLPQENGVDCYVKRYAYHPNEFHLIAEESDGASTTEYVYMHETNLLCAKFVYDEKKQMTLRHYRFYDSMHILNQVIEDNGQSIDYRSLTGCTIRKIKKITNKKTFPGAGQPETIEEYYYDFETNQERLLRKIVFTYDPHNDPIQEDIYDGSNQFVYSIKRSFDLCGRCIYETDPLGNEIYRSYDANGNLIKEKGPGLNVEVENEYDLFNRKISCKQRDETGNLKFLHFQYDSNGTCLSQVDERGNETKFAYDGLSRKIKEVGPVVQSSEGSFKAYETTMCFDMLNHLIESTDEEGNRTFTKYNIRGQPTHIKTLYTTGNASEESFVYDLKGNCVQKCSANGLITLFSYDYLDRVTKVSHKDSKGHVLSETNARYNGFVLLSTIDAEGVETCLEYDGAGRERKITKGRKCIEKGYDSLGYLAWQKEWIDDERFLIKRFTHDCKGQLLEESCEENGRIYAKKGFSYDAGGRQVSLKAYISENVFEEMHFIYDAFGREIKKEDPLGRVWKTEYLDSLGMKKIFTPDGSLEETHYDPLQRVSRVIRRDSSGNRLNEKEFFYDGLSNLSLFREEGNDTQFIYEGKRQIAVIEGSNKENPRETLSSYGTSGELKTKATALNRHEFKYDALGRVVLHSAHSTQEKIEVAYAYDGNGKVVKVGQNGKETLRQYDEHGQLIFEKQQSGFSVSYAYDFLGRRTQMDLPDGAKILYAYEGPYLFAVSYLDKTGKTVSKHTYKERDLSGKIGSLQTEGGKKILYEYDALGRVDSLQANGFGQRAKYDVKGNLIELSSYGPLGLTTEQYAYSPLNELKSENGQEFTYDVQGNRQDGKLGPFNQLVEAIGCAFAWNEEGYLTKSSGSLNFSCKYDPLGRMTNFQNTAYEYDGFNRRIVKNDSYFLYDGMNEIGIIDKDGNFLEFRVLGEGKGAEMGSTLVVKVGLKCFSAVNDLRGNVALLSEIGGKEWEFIRYSAFGVTDVFSSNKEGTKNRWRFCGKREDDESGWIFFGRRYYMPKIGRWISPDPLGIIDGSNLYTFVHNNPLTHFDLYGLYDAVEPWGTKSAGQFCGMLLHMAMGAVEWIGKNLIPLPGVRDFVEGVGRGFSGGHFFDTSEYLKSVTQVGKIEGEKITGHTYVWINGVRTTYEQAKEVADEFSKQLGEVEVYFIYNATNGLLTDLLECIALRFGMISAPEQKILEFVRGILSESPDEMIHIQAHSQGGLHLYNAGKQMKLDEMMHIEANTFGSAKIIPEGIFRTIDNHISKLDIVPLFDTFAYIRAWFSESPHVHFITPTTFSPLKEHFLTGKTYGEEINQMCGRFAGQHR